MGLGVRKRADFDWPPSFTGSAAYALDAADGVIDGKYFGRQITQSVPLV